MQNDPEHVIEEIRIPLNTYVRLVRRAAQLGVDKEQFVQYALLRYIDEHTPRDPPTDP